jgi:hypothetical protein
MLVSTPIGEIDSPKLKSSLKGLNSVAPTLRSVLLRWACHICIYVDLLPADGWNFTGNRYFFYGAAILVLLP